jgi:hypothetical protein
MGQTPTSKPLCKTPAHAGMLGEYHMSTSQDRVRHRKLGMYWWKTKGMTHFSLAYSFAIAMILTVSNVARADSEAPVTIFNIGDSLITSSGIHPPSAKFQAVLEQALTGSGHSANVIDTPFHRMSANGLIWVQSTDGLKVLETPANTAAILELGSNDCEVGATLAQTKANLDLILEAFSKKHIPVLLVGTTASESRSKKNGFVSKGLAWSGV